jgi:hypothetical protein
MSKPTNLPDMFTLHAQGLVPEQVLEAWLNGEDYPSHALEAHDSGRDKLTCHLCGNFSFQAYDVCHAYCRECEYYHADPPFRTALMRAKNEEPVRPYGRIKFT